MTNLNDTATIDVGVDATSPEPELELTPPDQRRKITVAYGDGIGPEIMDATLKILQAAGASLELDEIRIGEKAYRQGHTSGIPPEAWESLRRSRVFLKAPITTPQGGGYKSLNVTIRKTLGLYANVRPAIAYAPFVPTKHPGMDVVIIRENEEDTYAGIEHRQTDEVAQCLKLITRPGCERICRYAFEYAQANKRQKVTCLTKDNIMKITDGMFHSVFDEIGAEYPHLEKEHWIVDIGAAKLATDPEQFDVIVTPNLYGDILSDVAAQITGSVGLAGSANIGDSVAMFEAIHGSAPTIAGQDVANPSGLLHGAIMMLVHLGQTHSAKLVHDAWLTTLEDGIHTADVYSTEHSTQQVGTAEFAQAVMARLGQQPRFLKAADYQSGSAACIRRPSRRLPGKKQLVGVDVFFHQADISPEELASGLQKACPPQWDLRLITNRGVKVWPNGFPETFCTDHWRCRFKSAGGEDLSHQQIVSLLSSLAGCGFDFIKTENLCLFDGQPSYSLGQGE